MYAIADGQTSSFKSTMADAIFDPSEFVAQRMRDLGLSSRDVARLSEGAVSHTHVSDLIRGERSWSGLSIKTLEGLARGLNLTFEELLAVVRQKYPLVEQQSKIIEELGYLEADFAKEFVAVPVVPNQTVSASSKNENQNSSAVMGFVTPESLRLPPRPKPQYAFFPKSRMRGANLKNVKAYLVNGDCMISEETRKVRDIAHGDYIAVEVGRPANPGDIVVGYWVRKKKLIIKRFGIENGSVVLYPSNPNHPVLTMEEGEFHYIGKFLARSG